MKRAFRLYGNKMFLIFSFIIMIGIGSTTLMINFGLEELYQEQSEDLVDELTNKTNNAFLHSLGNMDRMAIQLMTNPEVNEILRLDYSKLSEQEKLSYRTDAEAILMNVISPIFEMRRVSIFSDTLFFTVGVSEVKNSVQEAKSNYIDFLKSYFKDETKEFYISPKTTDPWSDNTTSLIYFVRCIRYGNEKLGFIEIQQDYDEIYEELGVDFNEPSPYIQVNNVQNELLFNNRDTDLFLDEIIEFGLENYQKEQVLNSKEYYFQTSQQEKYELIILVAQSKELLFEYYYLQRKLLLLGMAILLLVLFGTSWYVAKCLTKPLKDLKEQMNQLNLNTLSELIETDDSAYDEMKQIYQAFNNMNEKLQDSIEALVESKKMEYKAQRAALQSQISPHFIGNTLSVIGAKGYECGAYVVDEMCVLLSSMMRYLTEQSDFTTTIEQEVEYTIMYLRLIKYRYEERFEYEVIIDPSMENLRIPRLILQPIVENSVLYGYSPQKQHLKVCIIGEIREHKWCIKVQDNGQGFSEEKKKQLLDKIRDYESSGKIAGLGNVKVGLMNSYLRLKLENKNHTFDIISDENRTCIVLGGEFDV